MMEAVYMLDCTDSLASNYDSLATIDDGSYLFVDGMHR